MINSCINCTRKHIGTAHAYLMEVATGRYPNRFWLCIGEMVVAWEECYRKFPELAEMIDNERIKMIEDDSYFTDFVPIIEFATELANKEQDEEENEEENIKPPTNMENNND